MSEVSSILGAICLLTYADLHKMYYDDESYNKGHGHAYEFLGIKPEGAIVIVRPDQCKCLDLLQRDANC